MQTRSARHNLFCCFYQSLKSCYSFQFFALSIRIHKILQDFVPNGRDTAKSYYVDGVLRKETLPAAFHYSHILIHTVCIKNQVIRQTEQNSSLVLDPSRRSGAFEIWIYSRAVVQNTSPFFLNVYPDNGATFALPVRESSTYFWIAKYALILHSNCSPWVTKPAKLAKMTFEFWSKKQFVSLA